MRILHLTILLPILTNAFNNTPTANNSTNEGRRSFLSKAAATLSTATSILIPQSASAIPFFSSDKSNRNSNSPIQYGDESIMSPKSHGTSNIPVQSNLRYEVSNSLADKICNYNRHFAEFSGYFQTTPFESILKSPTTTLPLTFYDSNTGKPLFKAPIGRTVDEFLYESKVHGWPSFRDEEVIWDNVRVLKNSGETVSIDGTHLGHNLPDGLGNRYCINLVSVAGNPV